MKKLDGMSPDAEDWQPTFEILMHGVLHHATEEEIEMFPKLREAISEKKMTESRRRRPISKVARVWTRANWRLR